ncbi:hypothetical protein ABMC89_00365 [Sulfitobacter sp. HNIBRBA3233]|uniref:hypothetical protein n=1 Tax=Sulfitobacter marinivivus TaxID=3158558 RepID=UPI0032DEB095
MFDTTKKLEISPDDVALIERALETQSKILRVEASAGGRDATDRLNEVKRVLATVSAQRDRDTGSRRASGGSWTGFLRMMGQTT